MSDTRESAIRVRLDRALKERLDAFCQATRRNQTNAVNLLLDEALRAHEGPAK